MCVREHGSNVRRKEVLALANADDQRHIHARPDQALGLRRVHHSHGIGAVCLAQRGARRVRDVTFVRLLDQVRQRLCIRFG